MADDTSEEASVTDEVYGYLHSAISTGEFADGAPLSEEKLAAQLGTSRMPVRAALARLADEELVELRRGRPPIVRPITKQEAIELFDAYIIVARPLYLRGAARLTAADLAVIETRFDQFAFEARAGDAKGALHHLGVAFDRIFRASGNTVLYGVLKSLQPRAGRVARHRYPDGVGVAALERHHDEIAALRAGDVEGAMAVFDRNWAAMVDAVVATYDEE